MPDDVIRKARIQLDSVKDDPFATFDEGEMRVFRRLLARAEAWEMVHGARKPATYDQYDQAVTMAHELVAAADREDSDAG